jgi:hypothetical protein
MLKRRSPTVDRTLRSMAEALPRTLLALALALGLALVLSRLGRVPRDLALGIFAVAVALLGIFAAFGTTAALIGGIAILGAFALGAIIYGVLALVGRIAR